MRKLRWPVLPLRCGEAIERDAAVAALQFWRRVAEDERVSLAYRACAAERALLVAAWRVT